MGSFFKLRHMQEYDVVIFLVYWPLIPWFQKWMHARVQDTRRESSLTNSIVILYYSKDFTPASEYSQSNAFSESSLLSMAMATTLFLASVIVSGDFNVQMMPSVSYVFN